MTSSASANRNAAGLGMNDGNGGNNYAVSYVANIGGVITPASLSVVRRTTRPTPRIPC